MMQMYHLEGVCHLACLLGKVVHPVQPQQAVQLASAPLRLVGIQIGAETDGI